MSLQTMLVPCLSTLTNWVIGLISSHLRFQAIMVSSRNLLPSEQFRKQTQGYAVTRVTFSAWNPGPQLLHSFKIDLVSVEPLERLLMTCPEVCPPQWFPLQSSWQWALTIVSAVKEKCKQYDGDRVFIYATATAWINTASGKHTAW